MGKQCGGILQHPYSQTEGKKTSQNPVEGSESKKINTDVHEITVHFYTTWTSVSAPKVTDSCTW